MLLIYCIILNLVQRGKGRAFKLIENTVFICRYRITQILKEFTDRNIFEAYV